MFQVLSPVTIHPTAESWQPLGDQLRLAGSAAWQDIARRGLGLEFAYLPFRFGGATLALSSRLRRDGFIVIELSLDDGRQPARLVTASEHRRPWRWLVPDTEGPGRRTPSLTTRHERRYGAALATNSATQSIAPSLPPRPALGCTTWRADLSVVR